MNKTSFSQTRGLNKFKVWAFLSMMLFFLFNFKFVYALEFEPNDISGLSIWLKADSITGINDEEQFGFWGDSSSSNHDFSQSTAANQPTYISSVSTLNNKPAVRFDGANDIFTSNDSFSFGDHSIFVAYQDNNGVGPDEFTKLLLSFDGNFTDSSDSVHTITSSGVGTDSTPDSPLTPDSDVASLDGNDSLSIPDSDDWDMGTGDFTIDFWVRLDSGATGDNTIFWQGTNENNANFMDIDLSASKLRLNLNNFTVQHVLTWNPSFNTWYHVAVVRSGNTFTSFIDGVSIGSTTDSDGWGNFSQNFIIGHRNNFSHTFLKGKLEEFRISKGIARWTTNFTRPTEPITFSNTNFERLVDHKLDDGFWLGRDGDQVSSWGGGIQEAETPNGIFVPVDDATPHILFSERKDGIHDLFGDGVTLARNTVSTDVTSTNAIGIGGIYTGLVGDNFGGDIAEVIIYDRALTDEEQSLVEEYLSEKYDIPISVGIGTSEPHAKLSVNGTIQTIPRREATCDTKQEGAVYYNSDSKKLFVCDGTNWVNLTGAGNGSSDEFTKLLLHFDGDFKDSSNSVHAIASNIGLASTPDSPLIPDSDIASFDGINDSLSIPDSNDWDMGTGDFTIDFWVRLDSGATGDNTIFWQGTNENMANFLDIDLNANKLRLFLNNFSVQHSLTWSPSFNTWYHVAVVRSGDTFTSFIDGTSIGTTTDSDGWGNFLENFIIGHRNNISTTFLKGKLEEFRISKGIARWTANFTRPTEPHN